MVKKYILDGKEHYDKIFDVDDGSFEKLLKTRDIKKMVERITELEEKLK